MRLAVVHVFDRALDLTLRPSPSESGPLHFEANLDRELWVADSGPWGGYVAALFAKAITEVADDLALTSLTVHFVRRLTTGPADVVLEVEARGRRVGHLSARLVQGGATGAIATATIASNPQDDFVSDLEMPLAPPASETRRRAESSHAYMQHLDVRPTILVRPWSGDNEGTLMGWIRMAEPRPLDVPLLAALPDGWTPGTWARLTEPAGKVTVNMTTHFRSAMPTSNTGTNSDWCFIRVRTRHVERGFADEDCELWDANGHLLVQSRQLVLLAR